VGAGESLGRLRVGLPRFQCSVDVYFAIDADKTDTLSGITAATETIRKALDDAVLGGTVYGAPDFLRAGRVTVAHYRMEANGLGCEATASTVRYLVNETGLQIYNETGLAITVP
jgi:hypothetical protein